MLLESEDCSERRFIIQKASERMLPRCTTNSDRLSGGSGCERCFPGGTTAPNDKFRVRPVDTVNGREQFIFRSAEVSLSLYRRDDAGQSAHGCASNQGGLARVEQKRSHRNTPQVFGRLFAAHDPEPGMRHWTK
jgi:hypothetical protein